MRVSRRTLVSGGGAVAIAAAVPARRTSAQPALYVRQSIDVLMREQSPRIASFRRGVDAMMRLPTWDKRNWWFQANMHGVAADQIPPEMVGSAERYFSKCPHRTYFFLAWNRMYVYFFERILRALSGDPRLTLPYWAYDDPQQLRLPPAFLPDADELETGSPAAANPYARRNPLARAIRPSALDRGVAGLRPDLARQLGEAMALATFATTNRAEANQAFGGARVQALAEAPGIGGIESVHNDVHDTLGLGIGDLGSAVTAARDPLFWCLHATVDRLWAKWTSIGREPPTRDPYWMNTTFTFVDENGQDVRMAGAHILDNQFQLLYRYDDEPARRTQFAFSQSTTGGAAAGPAIVVARAAETRLVARENRIALTVVSATTSEEVRTGRFRVIVRDATARDRTSPYEILLGAGNAAPVRMGTLALFGPVAPARNTTGATLTFDATRALLQLARSPGFDLAGLHAVIVRRGLIDSSGQELVAPDPDPPRIAMIELVKG